MTDVPRRALARTAKLAALPLGLAGRAAVGAGRRLGGRPAEDVTAAIQEATAEHIFSVLGQLKGGALKVGQALSVLEGTLPEEIIGPYRAALTRLQEAAPPLPAEKVHDVLADSLGPRWRTKFARFEDEATAAASIGQVHQAVWKDGRLVAVKIKYPGAGPALIGDFRRIAALARVGAGWVPGLDLGPLVAQLLERVKDELDYDLEARRQRRFGEVFEGDPHVFVPAVVHQRGDVIVTEWLDGTPLAQIIEEGSAQERNRAAAAYLEFLVCAPQRTRLLHADPHPGNFRLLADGRLGVLDFGAVDELPHGLPPAMGHLMTLALRGDAIGLLAGLREEGFVLPGTDPDPEHVLDLLLPFLAPLTSPTFTFSRSWLRSLASRLRDPRSPQWRTSLQLNLPPDYLLIHRVWAGGVGVLCQLEGEVPAAAIMSTWLPGLQLPASARGPAAGSTDEPPEAPDLWEGR